MTANNRPGFLFILLAVLLLGFNILELIRHEGDIARQASNVIAYLAIMAMLAATVAEGKRRSMICFWIFSIPLAVLIFVWPAAQTSIHAGYALFFLIWAMHEKFNHIRLLAKYIPGKLADALVFNDSNQLRGEFKEITIMFCDIQSFTRLSEKVDPEELVLILNHYFSELSAVLQRHGATIDKYIGDSIMAFWNAPACQAEHADQAIDAAYQMRFALARLNRKLTRSNLPPLSIGIAIHTGKAAVGLMGSSQRLSYTAVGEAVNLCARLEALTRNYNTNLLISNTTRLAAGRYDFKYLDRVIIRGSCQSMSVYTPLVPDREPNDKYHQAAGKTQTGEMSLPRRAC